MVHRYAFLDVLFFSELLQAIVSISFGRFLEGWRKAKRKEIGIDVGRRSAINLRINWIGTVTIIAEGFHHRDLCLNWVSVNVAADN